jgi:hypothetical protein
MDDQSAELQLPESRVLIIITGKSMYDRVKLQRVINQE